MFLLQKKNALVALVVVCFPLVACGIEEVEATIGTDSATTMPPEPDPECASPFFSTTGTGGPDEGSLYECEGQAVGQFEYHQCGLFDCDDFESKPIDGESGDGAIPFPPDTSETEGDGEEVYACCTDEIEVALDGEERGETACLSACAHAACTQAIARFDELIDDIDVTAAACGMTQFCKDNVLESLLHYRTFILENFDDCVAAAMSANAPFQMGLPGCGQSGGAGCLVNGALDITCEVDAIDLNSASGICTEAEVLPPETVTSQGCTIDVGGGRVRDSQNVVDADFTGGSAQVHVYDCAIEPCSVVLEGLAVTIEDFAADGYDLSELEVELYIAAFGVIDDGDLTFPAGAIQVRVTGEADDGSSVIPFDVLGASTEPALGTYEDDELVLWEVTFQAGGYNFTADIEESSCANL